MRLIIDVGSSVLRLLVLVLAVALLAAAFSIARRLYQFSTWVKDVKGPKSPSFLAGNYADFYTSDIIRVCLRWMSEYGGIVRHKAFLGEPRLLVSDPVALEYILVKHPYMFTKQPDFARFLVMIMGPGLLASEGEQHRRQKRALQAGFAPNSVRAYYPIFLHHARHLRHRLLETIDAAKSDVAEEGLLIDMLKPSARVSVDILGHAGFGQPFNALAMDNQFGAVRSSAKEAPLDATTQPLMRAFDSLIETVAGGGAWRMACDVAIMFVPWFAYLPFTVKHDPKVKQARKTMDAEAARVLDNAEEAERERVRVIRAERHETDNDEKTGTSAPIEQSPQNPASIVSFMMRARDMALQAPVRKQDMRLTPEDLYGQVTTLMLAGHETTSTALTWMAHGLSQNPAGQEKLKNAVQNKRAELGLSPVSRAYSDDESVVVPDDDTDADAGRELTLDELESITYFDWAVQEMLRIYSPIHTSSRTATEDTILPVDPELSPSAPATGIPIHKGVTFIIPIEAINLDPKLWGQDAEEFRPERWGDDSLPGVRRYRGLKGGMSFMYGVRGCIGARFSVVELKAILAVLLTSVRFVDAKRTVVRSRWIVARPWDPQAGREQCPVRIAKV